MGLAEVTSDENEMLSRLMWGLRNKLRISDDSCYVTMMPAYIEGMSPQTIQISPGGSIPDTTIDGGQQGGSIQRRPSFKLDFFRTLKMDLPSMSEQMLLEETYGINDWVESVRDALAMTTLGGASLEPVRWEGETEMQWIDMRLGVGRKTMTVSATYRKVLPSELTLTDEDCRPRLPS